MKPTDLRGILQYIPQFRERTFIISIDGAICSIGSANIDIRSFSINYELNAVFYSDRIAEELETQFARDLAHCREFDALAYRKRGRVSRFRDSVARVLSPLL